MMDTSSVHRQAWDLIPWIVNDSAPESERQAVQAHLESCADCRQELEFQRQLHAAMAQRTPRRSMRDSWQRLRSRLDAAAGRRAAVRAARRLPRRAGRRRHAVADRGHGGAGDRPRSARSRLVVAPARRRVHRRPATAGRLSDLVRAAGGGSGGTIRVVFAPELTMAQLQAVLAAAAAAGARGSERSRRLDAGAGRRFEPGGHRGGAARASRQSQVRFAEGRR
jgi:hypothetical protein